MKRTDEYKSVMREYMEMTHDIKWQPIRESNKEKKEYVRKELNELAESKNWWDKIRYKCLLKLVS